MHIRSLLIAAALAFVVSAAAADPLNSGIVQTVGSKPIDIATADTTVIVPGATGRLTYITSWNVGAAGTGNFQWVEGHGVKCGTGQSTLSGAYNFKDQGGMAPGNGLGPVLITTVPGDDVCAVTTQAVQMSGSASYEQH